MTIDMEGLDVANGESFLTKEECDYLASCMENKYGIYLDGRKFGVMAIKDGDAVFVKTTLRNEDDSFHYPVEARVKYREQELTPRRAALFLIDYIDVYFEEFLTGCEAIYLPIDWTDHEYDTVGFQIRGQILNLKVESMADRILESGTRYEGPNIII